MDNATWLSVLCSASIVATTVHAQDFQDVIGDKLIGRHTLAIEHPTLARPMLMAILVAWSMALSSIWGLSSSLGRAYSILGALVGWRFVLKRSVKSDQRSFYLYNVG